jgi:hypothetical protein
MYGVVYRVWVYTIYTQMRRCHEYMSSSAAQEPFLVAGEQYRIFQNLGWKQRKLQEIFKRPDIRIVVNKGPTVYCLM